MRNSRGDVAVRVHLCAYWLGGRTSTTGAENFRNSIARIKCNPKNFARYAYGNVRDSILFYSMSPKTLTWNPQREPLESDIERLYPQTDVFGRRYTTTPLRCARHHAGW